jgi:hypothetical protein
VRNVAVATLATNAKATGAALQTANANADGIATFLSGANPNLPQATLRALLIAHVGHHAAQHQQLKDKQYAGEAKTWEAMRTHMYTIADALGDAIAKQFPQKF